MVSFVTQSFYFDEFLLIYLFFVFLVLYLRSHCLTSVQKDLHLGFFSWAFYSFTFYIKTFGSLWIDFCGWYKEEAQLHLLHVAIQMSWHVFWRLSFPTLNGPGTLVEKLFDKVCEVYFWPFYSIGISLYQYHLSWLL